MAVEKIALGINLRKNKISTSAGFGKYYPEVDTQKTLSLRGFAQHMVDHGSIYGRAVVEGVLMQIVDCLPELVAQGVPVQLGSLGTFYPTAEVMPKTGAVPNIAAMDGLNPNDIVKAIHIRYLPDSTKLDNLCGPQFKNRCTLELRNIVDSTASATVRMPSSAYSGPMKTIPTTVFRWRGCASTATAKLHCRARHSHENQQQTPSVTSASTTLCIAIASGKVTRSTRLCNWWTAAVQ